jgi:hypothetical protein
MGTNRRAFFLPACSLWVHEWFGLHKPAHKYPQRRAWLGALGEVKLRGLRENSSWSRSFARLRCCSSVKAHCGDSPCVTPSRQAKSLASPSAPIYDMTCETSGFGCVGFLSVFVEFLEKLWKILEQISVFVQCFFMIWGENVLQWIFLLQEIAEAQSWSGLGGSLSLPIFGCTFGLRFIVFVLVLRWSAPVSHWERVRKNV